MNQKKTALNIPNKNDRQDNHFASFFSFLLVDEDVLTYTYFGFTVFPVSVVDPHHVGADPDSTYHPDAYPYSDFFYFDADPDPTFHTDADPDPGPSLKKGSNP
jgi:hypothetical protein